MPGPTRARAGTAAVCSRARYTRERSRERAASSASAGGSATASAGGSRPGVRRRPRGFTALRSSSTRIARASSPRSSGRVRRSAGRAAPNGWRETTRSDHQARCALREVAQHPGSSPRRARTCRRRPLERFDACVYVVELESRSDRVAVRIDRRVASFADQRSSSSRGRARAFGLIWTRSRHSSDCEEELEQPVVRTI